MLQIEDKDLPILSHLIDVEVVHLRDEPPTASTKSEDEDEDDDDDLPKVTIWTVLNNTQSLTVLTSFLQAATQFTTVSKCSQTVKAAMW